ncbi:MAG: hypothetical protein ACR5KW_04585 [Wolbachia sp.]
MRWLFINALSCNKKTSRNVMELISSMAKANQSDKSGKHKFIIIEIYYDRNNKEITEVL